MAQRDAFGATGSAKDSPTLSPSRRRFITIVLSAIGAAITAILGVPLAGFFVLPALRESERQWLEVGAASQFPEGQITKVIAHPLITQIWPHENPRTAIYVLNQGGGNFTLYQINCTHVGCPVQWSGPAGRFFCPCHGGVFDAEGRVLAGPPPRPLDRYEYKIEKGIIYAGRIYKVNENLEFSGWQHA